MLDAMATAPAAPLPLRPPTPPQFMTQMPQYWGLPRADSPQTRVTSPADSPRGASLLPPSAGALPQASSAGPLPRPARWARAGRGGRFGSNEERKKFYFDKAVEADV